MKKKQEKLLKTLQEIFSTEEITFELRQDLSLTISLSAVRRILSLLRDHALLRFEQLIDVCVVDYLSYGQDDWNTETVTTTGFSRAVRTSPHAASANARFGVVYHLLSVSLNQRVRVKVLLEEAYPVIPSVHDIWASANWFEREGYDLFGVLFEGHPDLRRILTDYGFIGHPFRKDFPVSGYVEMRYDAETKKVVYEPVEIEPRVSVPRVIRKDSRYYHPQEKSND